MEFCATLHFREATTAKRMKIDAYYQQQKCSPMTLVSGNIRRMWIFAGCQMTVALSTTVIFGTLGGYFFGNVKRQGQQYYVVICDPRWPVIDCKMNDLE